MVNKLYDYLKDCMNRNRTLIDTIDKNYDKIQWLNYAYLPYLYKYKYKYMLDYLEKNGVNTPSLKDEYTEFIKKLNLFEQKRGKDFRDKVYQILKLDVSRYPNAIGTMFEPDGCSESLNNFDRRDAIEILMMELEKDYNLTDIRETVMKLDRTFKMKYIEHIRPFLKECPLLEEEWLPERFWWRHPEKVLSELPHR